MRSDDWRSCAGGCVPLIYNHMVVSLKEHAQADRCFRALADATRRDILAVVMADDHSVSALASRYEMSFAAVQKHVAVLERAHLVTKHRHGREQLVRGNGETVREASRLLDQIEMVLRERLDRFENVLTANTTRSSEQ